jgi:hypothetical protein
MKIHLEMIKLRWCLNNNAIAADKLTNDIFPHITRAQEFAKS